MKCEYLNCYINAALCVWRDKLWQLADQRLQWHVYVCDMSHVQGLICRPVVAGQLCGCDARRT
jgi:hypothetical protein